MFAPAPVSTLLLLGCAMVCFVSRVWNQSCGSQESKGSCVIGITLSKGSVVMPKRDCVEVAPLCLLICEDKLLLYVTALLSCVHMCTESRR